jgi:hypothetical protein
MPKGERCGLRRLRVQNERVGSHQHGADASLRHAPKGFGDVRRRSHFKGLEPKTKCPGCGGDLFGHRRVSRSICQDSDARQPGNGLL